MSEEASFAPEGPKTYAVNSTPDAGGGWVAPSSVGKPAGGRIGPRGYEIVPEGARLESSEPVFNLKTSSSHKVRSFGDFKYWAQNGRVHIVNEIDGEYKSCSIDDFAKRALTLASMTRKARDAAQRRALTNVVGEMTKALYEAKEQGDPHDPKVLEYRMRQRRPKAKLGYAKADYFAEAGPLAGDDYFPTAIVGNRRPIYEAR